MTRVDFYILDKSDNDARLNFACRLAEKAVAQAHQVLVNVGSAADGSRLDELLWTFSQGSFLPHRRYPSSAPDEGEPILIGEGTAPPDAHTGLMINLTAEVPSYFGRFERVAELIGADNADRAAGRQRFRYYRAQGCDLHTHQI